MRPFRIGVAAAWVMVALLFAVATFAPQAWAEGAVEPLGWEETNAGNASGVLIVAVRGVPPSLDPHWDSTTDTRDIAWHVFEALFTLDDAYDVVPMLAESYEASEDAKHWTIHLRRGVRFHDGNEMKAADVVASLRRWGQVAPAGKAFFEGVESIESVGEYAVQISLSRPNSALPAILSDTLQFAAIYPERIAVAAGADRPIEEYVGTGPFKFVEKRPNGSIRLARFDEYTARSEPASGYGGRRTAAVGQLVFHPESSARERLAGLLDGRFDFAEDLSPDAYQALVERQDVDPAIVRPYYWAGVIFNKAKGLFADPRMREAVRVSLAVEPILEAAFGNRVFYEPSHSLHAAGTVWHSDAGQDRWNRPDPALAKQILAEAGYDGTPVRWLATYEYPWMVEIAYAAKEQLAAVGIPVDVEIMDWASLVARRADPDAWEIFVTSFPSAVHPMENPYLASEWPGWWRSEARDALIQELLTDADIDDQREIWGRIQEVFWEELPIYPLGEYFLLRGVRSDVLMDADRPGMYFWNAKKLRAHAHGIEVSYPQIDAWKYDLPGAESVEKRIRSEALFLIWELSSIGSVWGDYEVHVDEGDLLSVTLLYSGYHESMAHPMHFKKSITGDLRTGKIYTLADLFTGGDYVEELSKIVAQKIEEDDAPTLVEFERISPDQDFYLTEDALVLYYQLYDLYPYAWGFPEFRIPYEEIRSLLKDGGPVSLLLGE